MRLAGKLNDVIFLKVASIINDSNRSLMSHDQFSEKTTNPNKLQDPCTFNCLIIRYYPRGKIALQSRPVTSFNINCCFPESPLCFPEWWLPRSQTNCSWLANLNWFLYLTCGISIFTFIDRQINSSTALVISLVLFLSFPSKGLREKILGLVFTSWKHEVQY